MAVRNDFTAGEVLAAADLNDTFASKLDLAGGKILQIVRATDGTDRSTTSTSLVDATINVTITPQKSDSAILVIWSARVRQPSAQFMVLTITDSSNNQLSGAQTGAIGSLTSITLPSSLAVLIGYATPATTSAVTYKGRFNTDGGTGTLLNSGFTGQMYALEISA